MRARVSNATQLVLPVEVLSKYGILPGQEMELIDMGGHLQLFPRGKRAAESARGARGAATSFTAAQLEFRSGG